jgi:hypothetical protein
LTPSRDLVVISQDLGGAAVAEPPRQFVVGVFRRGHFRAGSAPRCTLGTPHAIYGHRWGVAAAKK